MSPRSKQSTLVPPHVGATGSRMVSGLSSRTSPDPSRLSTGSLSHMSSEAQFTLSPSMDHLQQTESAMWSSGITHRFSPNEHAHLDAVTLDSYSVADNFMMPVVSMNSCYDATAPTYPILNQGAMSQTLSGPYQESLFEHEIMQSSPVSVSLGFSEYNHYPQATIRHGLPSPPAECFNDLQDDLTMDPMCDISFSTLPGSAVDAIGFEKVSLNSSSRSMQPRPLRSASERTTSAHPTMVPQDIQYSRDDRADKVKARNDPRYDQKPDTAGYYHCPLAGEEACNHKPTKQKCIYAKYLDSHLKPYACKHGGPGNECENLRFSSNACLFRHEREAHGMHNHGMNPFLCLYPGCERSRKDNGFPRRWNQRDHMKRVHDWIETDANDGQNDKHGPNESHKRRKQSGSSNGIQMKRSSSSQAKAQAATFAHGSRNVNMARYQARMDKQLQDCNLGFPMAVDDMQFSTFQSQSSKTPSAYASSYQLAY